MRFFFFTYIVKTFLNLVSLFTLTRSTVLSYQSCVQGLFAVKWKHEHYSNFLKFCNHGKVVRFSYSCVCNRGFKPVPTHHT